LATIIDHIITNCRSNNHQSVILTSKISDHFPLVHFLNSKKPVVKPKTFTSRNFSKTNLDQFGANLANINWENLEHEVDAQSAYNNLFRYFSDSLQSTSSTQNNKI